MLTDDEGPQDPRSRSALHGEDEIISSGLSLPKSITAREMLHPDFEETPPSVIIEDVKGEMTSQPLSKPVMSERVDEQSVAPEHITLELKK